jgi:tripeptide aminopeptidase
MKKNNFLASIMKVQSASYKTHRMAKFITKTLQKDGLGYTKDKYGNIYVTKGDAELYPTMVCHIDTVHSINDNVRIVRTGDKMFAIDSSNCHRIGIGGDDKVGIYITLCCLRKFDNFKAVFFLDEEVGCVGSGQADFSFFDDSTLVLECDRRGYGDFVTNISGTKLSDDTLIDDIQHILDEFKFVTCNGGITDVGEIAENTDVQVANMSCGYYEPHSDNEYIVISEVEKVKRMCMKILASTQLKKYTMPKDSRVTYYDYGYGDGWYGHNYYGTKPNDNNGQGTAYYDNIYHDDDAEYVSVNQKCNECNHAQMLYDEYEDAFWCQNCGHYISAYELDVLTEIHDDVRDEIEEKLGYDPLFTNTENSQS